MRKMVYQAPEVQVIDGVFKGCILGDGPSVTTGRENETPATPPYGGEGGDDDDNRVGRITIWDAE